MYLPTHDTKVASGIEMLNACMSSFQKMQRLDFKYETLQLLNINHSIAFLSFITYHYYKLIYLTTNDMKYHEKYSNVAVAKV